MSVRTGSLAFGIWEQNTCGWLGSPELDRFQSTSLYAKVFVSTVHSCSPPFFFHRKRTGVEGIRKTAKTEGRLHSLWVDNNNFTQLLSLFLPYKFCSTTPRHMATARFQSLLLPPMFPCCLNKWGEHCDIPTIKQTKRDGDQRS